MHLIIPLSPQQHVKSCTQFCLVDKLRIAERAIKIGWINCVAEYEGASVSKVRHWI